MAGMLDSNAVLVNKTADGVSIDAVFGEIARATELYNGHKGKLVDLVTVKTTEPAVAIPQTLIVEEFEQASPFGAPGAISPPPTLIKAGATLRDWDKRSAFSWRYLRDASSAQIISQVTRLIEADARLVQRLVFSRMLSPTPDTNEFLHTVYGAWSGDGIVPPRYYGESFDANHSHYVVTGSTSIDSGDLDLALQHCKHHGYGTTPGSRLLILANPSLVDVIASFRAGVVNNNSQTARHSFIPATANVVPYLTDQTLVGTPPPADVDGVLCEGSYGGGLVISTPLIPDTHFVVAVSYGAGNQDNPLSLRQHVSSDQQGLRFIPGPFQGYPLIDTMATRCIGTGARHRGGWFVGQLKASGSYTAPELNL